MCSILFTSFMHIKKILKNLRRKCVNSYRIPICQIPMTLHFSYFLFFLCTFPTFLSEFFLHVIAILNERQRVSKLLFFRGARNSCNCELLNFIRFVRHFSEFRYASLAVKILTQFLFCIFIFTSIMSFFVSKQYLMGSLLR